MSGRNVNGGPTGPIEVLKGLFSNNPTINNDGKRDVHLHFNFRRVPLFSLMDRDAIRCSNVRSGGAIQVVSWSAADL